MCIKSLKLWIFNFMQIRWKTCILIEYFSIIKFMNIITLFIKLKICLKPKHKIVYIQIKQVLSIKECVPIKRSIYRCMVIEKKKYSKTYKCTNVVLNKLQYENIRTQIKLWKFTKVYIRYRTFDWRKRREELFEPKQAHFKWSYEKNVLQIKNKMKYKTIKVYANSRMIK